MQYDLPEFKRKIGYKQKLRLVRDSGTGEPLIRTGYQTSRFQTFVESQGYISTYVKLDPKNDRYALYLSEKPVPDSQRTVEITSRMKGKMTDMHALSTATAVNPACRKQFRGKEGQCKDAICKECYSMKKEVESKKTGQPSQFHALPKLMRNTRLLTRAPLENVPKVSQPIFRFSAEGDLYNEQHLLNLYKIAEANPGTTFTLWTKRHNITRAVMAKYGLPRNLILIQSSMKFNTPERLLPGYSKVFTVYTKEYLSKHPEVKINCANRCASCQLCYTRNDVVYINELKKGR